MPFDLASTEEPSSGPFDWEGINVAVAPGKVPPVMMLALQLVGGKGRVITAEGTQVRSRPGGWKWSRQVCLLESVVPEGRSRSANNKEAVAV